MSIIIELLVLVYLILWIKNYRKRDRSILCCGIVAFSGKVMLNETQLKLLLLYNEKRGNDSSGFYIFDPTGKVELRDRVVKELGLLSEKLLPVYKFKESTCFIGHARKATTGARTKENAHPFVEKSKDGTKTIIGVHNGTVANYKDLLSKHKLTEYQCPVDSNIIIKKLLWEYEAGNDFEDALADLEGEYHALVFTRDDNTMYVYCRNMRDLYYGLVFRDAKKEEDREYGMYISSMKESLQALGHDNPTQFKAKILYEIKDGVIVSETEITPAPYKLPVQTTTFSRPALPENTVAYSEGDRDGLWIWFKKSFFFGDETDTQNQVDSIINNNKLLSVQEELIQGDIVTAQVEEVDEDDFESPFTSDSFDPLDESIRESETHLSAIVNHSRINDRQMYNELKENTIADFEVLLLKVKDLNNSINTVEKQLAPSFVVMTDFIEGIKEDVRDIETLISERKQFLTASK